MRFLINFGEFSIDRQIKNLPIELNARVRAYGSKDSNLNFANNTGEPFRQI